MKLDFVWKNFIGSPEGCEWVQFFSELPSRYQHKDKRLIEFLELYNALGKFNNRDSANSEITKVIDVLSVLRRAEAKGKLPKSVKSLEEAAEYFDKVAFLKDESDPDSDAFCIDDIASLSVALYCLHPKYFFPYYFYPNFSALVKICSEFSIFIPPVPKKTQKHERFFYYFELCQSLFNFWVQLGLEPELIPTFLYGFCPNALDLKIPIATTLPNARRAWLLGAGGDNGDFEFLESATLETKSLWTGNINTEVGDILIMYVTQPKSCIHSIWRAVAPGMAEPFRHYYSTLWMGFGKKFKPITLKELKADPIFSSHPLIRSNLQGVNGRLLEKKYYDHLLGLIEQSLRKRTLPTLDFQDIIIDTLKNERDVELKILEPLLVKLGFQDKEWERQVSLRVGRKEKVIPDYVVLPVFSTAERTVKAKWVWEAKYSVNSNAELKRDFEQVSSYARLVGAHGVGLISRDGVSVGLKADDFKVEKSRFWTITQLNQHEHFNAIESVAGRPALMKIR